MHLDRVPLREPDLEPWEIMISESQERMVAVVRQDFLAAGRAGLREVGARVRRRSARSPTTGELRAFWDDEVVGAIPARLLTDECPRYEVDREAPSTPTPRWTATYSPSEPNLASKEWVYRQYDQLVGSRTVRRPGLDAAVLRLRPSLRGLAVSLQGPPLGERDPFRAGLQAVFGAALNVACAGGEPLALTDCLNFGNPEKPEIALGARARDRGRSRRPRRRSGSRSSPATSRSTTRRTGARSRRRRSSAASASSRTSATCRRAGARATRSWLRAPTG